MKVQREVDVRLPKKLLELKSVQVCGTTNQTETFPKGEMIFSQV